MWTPVSTQDDTDTDTVDELERELAALKDEHVAATRAQRKTDLAEVVALTKSLGAGNVRVVDFEYIPGLPTLVVYGTPKKPEIRRYRDRMREGEKPGEKSVEAAEELGMLVARYPERKVFEAMCEARPAFKAQVGQLALGLALGKSKDEGKG